jgi:translocation and assembly module TamA
MARLHIITSAAFPRLARLGLLCAALAGPGCALTNTVVGRSDMPDAPVIRDVVVQGNSAVSDKDIVSGLATQPPKGFLFKDLFLFDPLALQVDLDRIETYYKKRGYYSAEVVDFDVKKAGSDSVKVAFAVKEGAPTRIADVKVEGLPPALRSDDTLSIALEGLVEGDVFEHERYLETKTRLEGWLAEHSYAHADVKGTVLLDKQDKRALVLFEVDPGPPVRFGRTRVTGLKRIPESAIRNRIAWTEGEPFDPLALDLTQGRLYALGHFATVRTDFEREGEPQVTDVTIHITEGTRRELRLGVGVAIDPSHWEVRGRAGYTYRGVPHPLATLALEARPAYQLRRADVGEDGIGGEARATLTWEDFLLPRVRSLTSVNYDVTELETYSTQGPGARFTLNRPLLGDHLFVDVGWQLRYLDLYGLHPSIPMDAYTDLGIVDPYRVGSYDQAIAYDHRDNVLDPHIGVFSELRVEEGGAFAGGRFDYVRATGELRGYVPIGRRLVAAARGRYGRLLSGELPITQRYYSGGAFSHRGFSQRQLSPSFVTDEAGHAYVGGDELFDGSAELRLDVFKMWEQWVGITGFVDAGDVATEVGALDMADLHYAGGLGLRYNTLVGPIRFDVAYRLNRTGAGNPAPEDRWAFHFSLGEAF